MKKLYLMSATALLLPLGAFAAGKDLNYLVELAVIYLDKALLVLMGFAVFMFVYNIIKYFVLNKGDRTEAGMYLLWSIIGFVIVLSFWGLVNILLTTFDLDKKPATWSELSNIFPSK